MRFNLGFFLAEAFKNLRLNLLMSITALTTTFICILVFGLGLLVSDHIQSIIGSVREDVSVEAFMPDASSQEVDALATEVAGWPEVASVNKVSEEEAFAEFKDKFKDQPDLYEDLDKDVFPASVQIQLKDPDNANEVAGKLKQEGFTESNLSYPQQTIDRLNSITSYVIWGLYAATLLFLIASVLLISNAIRISIFARRKEIEVMKLVGASDGFVRTPFVFEGLLQGFVGASLAALAVIWINFLFVDWAHNALPYVPISSGAVNVFPTMILLVAVGAGIGVIGSFISVTRFLRKI
ncbi:MAG: ABC transporter permease [Actinomycetota bacterium]|nr:ABC transporter permease [Actinomycetota bacterium]